MARFSLRFSSIQRFLSKFPLFSRPDKYSLGFLNVAQFTGVINDNIYKLALVFFLIELEGPESATLILSAAGAIFVIPFLLFSAIAGVLADRFSKSRLIMILKAVEILTFLLATAAFALKLKAASYALLFLLAIHSALFGPSKYGIIPELVPKPQVSKANGLITSFTYLAVILGTFLASFITELSSRNYVLVGSFCLFAAFIGFLSTFGIKYTPPQGVKKKISFAFLQEIFRTLSQCRNERHLLVAITGSAFFLFVGAFTQLNIIPFAMQSLGLTEIAGGYLFLTTALGIALGAFLAGRASKAIIELGLSCVAGLFIFLLYIALAFSAHQLIATLISLFLLGVFGGFFVVPFDSFIQIFSPEENRGHVIAATNFLSFCGVLLASLALFLFNQVLGFTAEKSFIVMGFLTLFFTLFFILRLSDLFLSYISRKILMRFIHLEPADLSLIEKTDSPLLVLEQASFIKGWLLMGLIPNLHLLLPQTQMRRFPWVQSLCYSIHRIPTKEKFEELVTLGKSYTKKDALPCIYLTTKIPHIERNFFSLNHFFKEKYTFILVKFEKTEDKTWRVKFKPYHLSV